MVCLCVGYTHEKISSCYQYNWEKHDGLLHYYCSYSSWLHLSGGFSSDYSFFFNSTTYSKPVARTREVKPIGHAFISPRCRDIYIKEGCTVFVTASSFAYFASEVQTLSASFQFAGESVSALGPFLWFSLYGSWSCDLRYFGKRLTYRTLLLDKVNCYLRVFSRTVCLRIHHPVIAVTE